MKVTLQFRLIAMALAAAPALFGLGKDQAEALTGAVLASSAGSPTSGGN
ncbi:hypothetical protein OKA05_25115 [Luteolibacter arcticus]|uniref:Uncharacterized protein n=1 Tax=Luteolibacter arcticus TaxID=1581411 RepID=A0ABT3GQR6_9BACT|nr:hypothetical protein [Luteolibacter arcticus]MCW1925864.1 hypothetical protein [Luteolibacter arcticus]